MISYIEVSCRTFFEILLDIQFTLFQNHFRYTYHYIQGSNEFEVWVWFLKNLSMELQYTESFIDAPCSNFLKICRDIEFYPCLKSFDVCS